MREYFRLEEKKKLSLKINSLSFSANTANLKNPSLPAINGLKVILLDVEKFLDRCLSYINFDLSI